MTDCTYGKCHRQGKYSLYQLRENLTKIWRTDLCFYHESMIVQENASILKGHKIREFREVHEEEICVR